VTTASDGGGYQEALARIHDEGFGHHARWAADLLLRRLAAAGHRGGLVVDLGSGSGILAERVVAAGFEVAGVDQSPAMVEIARRRAPGVRFAVGSFVDTEIPPCVAVTSVGEVLGYAFDARSGRDALRALFVRVRAALAPRGVFLFDLRGLGALQGTNFYEGDGWSIAVRTTVDDGARTLERDQVFFWREGDCWRRGHETHVLNLHDPGEVERDLRAAGFRVRRLRRYGERPFPGGLTGFAATV
jgi:SAM-dependent methyltransferase